MKTWAASLAALLFPVALIAQSGSQVTVSSVARVGCVSVPAAARVKANLQATHDAMVAGGRMYPSDEECARGAAAMERGVTKHQIEAIARSTVGDRSLVVAFDVLGRLVARRMPVKQAVAQVEANVSAGASDATLLMLTVGGGTTDATHVSGSAKMAERTSMSVKPIGGPLTTAVNGVAKRP